MPVSLPRLPLPLLAEGALDLATPSARYLTRVLRLSVGDRFEAFDPRTGATAMATLLSIDRDAARAELGVVSREGAADAATVLVQGYPKGDKLGDVVRDATELGATMIVPAICARSIARPDGHKLASRAQRLASIASEAARQCGRTRSPEVLAPMPWGDALSLSLAAASRGVVAWERAVAPIGDELLAIARDPAARQGGVAIAIGPEGGLTEEEVAQATALGFVACSFGKVILRTETAATAALAAWRVIAASAEARR